MSISLDHNQSASDRPRAGWKERMFVLTGLIATSGGLGVIAPQTLLANEPRSRHTSEDLRKELELHRIENIQMEKKILETLGDAIKNNEEEMEKMSSRLLTPEEKTKLAKLLQDFANLTIRKVFHTILLSEYMRTAGMLSDSMYHEQLLKLMQLLGKIKSGGVTETDSENVFCIEALKTIGQTYQKLSAGTIDDKTFHNTIIAALEEKSQQESQGSKQSPGKQ